MPATGRRRSVDPPSVPALAVTDLRASPGALLALCREEAARPFDLAQGPLLRARLFRVADDDHVLCLVMHHVASDGWSLRVLVEDLAALYEGAGAPATSAAPGPSLPPLPIRYADHAAWQRERLARGALDRELAYWKAELEGAPARLPLPTDRSRPPVLRFRGARCPFRLSAGLTAAIEALCRAEGVTPFMALFAAWNALVHRYTGADDLVVGTPVAGRSRRELEGLVGLFVNTLALRTRLDGDPTGRALLARVRDRGLGAGAHQELPFERLVEALRVERDPAHHPVFQVMFALQEPPARGRARRRGLPPRGPRHRRRAVRSRVPGVGRRGRARGRDRLRHRPLRRVHGVGDGRAPRGADREAHR